jgi:hypothetical protein
MSRRVIVFLLALAAGVGLGLLYGWVINPVQFVDTSPDSLRPDYKTDYVLMVAEAYAANGDLAWAARQLEDVGGSPLLVAQQAVLQAQKMGYAATDLQNLARLAMALQTRTPVPLGTP